MAKVRIALPEVRRLRGISQEFLAVNAGMSQTLLSQIENRRINPRKSELDRLAAVMGYEYDSETLLLPYDEWVEKFGGKLKEILKSSDDIIISKQNERTALE